MVVAASGQWVLIFRKLVRQRQRRQKGDDARTPKVKVWRLQFPSADVEHAWRHLPQNSPEWHAARAESSGASSLYRLMGYDEYRASYCLWMEDTGLVAEPERSIDECFATDQGHDYENEGLEFTEALLGCKIAPTGLWLHPTKPFVHASPDGLVTFPDVSSVLHPCLLQCSLRGLWEHKLRIHGLVQNRQGVAHWGFPHALKICYILQMMSQMSCTKTDWTILTNMWRFSEVSGVRPMPHGPFAYDEHGKPLLERPDTPGCWIVSTIQLSIVWYAPKIAEQLYRLLWEHMQACKRKEKPRKVDEMEADGPFRWCPLLHGVAYLTGSPSSVRFASEMFDPACIVRHIDSKEPRPDCWIGEWPPRVRVETRTFCHIKPMTWTLHMMKIA